MTLRVNCSKARPGMTMWRDAVPRNDNVERAEDWADRIIAARQRRKFTSLEDFARDTLCRSAR